MKLKQLDGTEFNINIDDVVKTLRAEDPDNPDVSLLMEQILACALWCTGMCTVV